MPLLRRVAMPLLRRVAMPLLTVNHINYPFFVFNARPSEVHVVDVPVIAIREGRATTRSGGGAREGHDQVVGRRWGGSPVPTAALRGLGVQTKYDCLTSVSWHIATTATALSPFVARVNAAAGRPTLSPGVPLCHPTPPPLHLCFLRSSSPLLPVPSSFPPPAVPK